jgi:hypothetical protein
MVKETGEIRRRFEEKLGSYAHIVIRSYHNLNDFCVPGNSRRTCYARSSPFATSQHGREVPNDPVMVNATSIGKRQTRHKKCCPGECLNSLL